MAYASNRLGIAKTGNQVPNVGVGFSMGLLPVGSERNLQSMTKKPTHDDVVRLLGPLSDQAVADILKLDASYADLEAVALRLAQENDVLGEMRHPLTGSAARIYDIVRSVDGEGDEMDGRV